MFKASVQEARLKCDRTLGYRFFFSRLAAAQEMSFAEAGCARCWRSVAASHG